MSYPRTLSHPSTLKIQRLIPARFSPKFWQVRAEVVSLGDARSYFLSTARNELGVVYAKSVEGAGPRSCARSRLVGYRVRATWCARRWCCWAWCTPRASRVRVPAPVQ